MNKFTHSTAPFRYWSLLFVGILSITLSFATNPVVPSNDSDPCKHDKEAPEIECPEDIYVYADCDDECVPVKFREPRAKDNCDRYPKVWCEYQSGHCFPVGKTEVWCWAKDKSGNESKHSFNVFVKEKPDKEAPRINCPKDLTFYADCNKKCVSVKFFEPTATDNCDKNPKVWCEYESGYCFPLGTTEVWCWAKDKSGNESKCSFNIIVKEKPDNEAPEIWCPKDIVEYIDCHSYDKCVKVKFDEPRAKDNCDRYPKVWCEYNSGYCFPLGATEVWCWAKDKSGNESKCYFTVTVKQKDNTPPVIYCPKDMDLYTDCGSSCIRMVWWMDATAKDDCDPSPKIWYETNGKTIDKWYCFPFGSNTVTAYAQDKAGNKSSCTYQVNVKYKDDLTPPTLTCPKDIMITLTGYNMCSKATFAVPTANDNCDPAPRVACTYYNGTAFVPVDVNFCYPMGKTFVRCTATDRSGNSFFCQFSITVMMGGDLVKANKDINNLESLNNKDKSKLIENVLKVGLESTDTDSNLSPSPKLLRKDLAVYPNPTNGLVNLDLAQYDGKNVAVQVLNSVGQQVYYLPIKEVTNQTYTLDMQSYPTGIYLVKVTSNGVETISRKIMKQ